MHLSARAKLLSAAVSLLLASGLIPVQSAVAATDPLTSNQDDIVLTDGQVLTSNIFASSITVPVGATVYFGADIVLSATNYLLVEGQLRDVNTGASYNIVLQGGSITLTGNVIARSGVTGVDSFDNSAAVGGSGTDGGDITISWPDLKSFTLAEGAILRSGDGGNGGQANVTTNETSSPDVTARGGDGGNGGDIILDGVNAIINGIIDVGNGGNAGYGAVWVQTGSPPADNGTANSTGGTGGSIGTLSVPDSYTIAGLITTGNLASGDGGNGGPADIAGVPLGDGTNAYDSRATGCSGSDSTRPAARGGSGCRGSDAYAYGGDGGYGIRGGHGGYARAYAGDGGKGGRGDNSGAALYGTNCNQWSDSSTDCPDASGGAGGYAGSGGTAVAYGGKGGIGITKGGNGGSVTAHGGDGGKGGDGGRGGGLGIWLHSEWLNEDLFFCVVDVATGTADSCVAYVISIAPYRDIICGAGGYRGSGGSRGTANATPGKGGTGLTGGDSGARDAKAGEDGANGARGTNGQYWSDDPGYDVCASASFPW